MTNLIALSTFWGLISRNLNVLKAKKLPFRTCPCIRSGKKSFKRHVNAFKGKNIVGELTLWRLCFFCRCVCCITMVRYLMLLVSYIFYPEVD